MNTKQTAIYERVKAAGGVLTLTSVRTYYYRRSTQVHGQGEITTGLSMIPDPQNRFPVGNQTRRPVLKLVSIEKIEKEMFDNPNIYHVYYENYTFTLAD